ncbi:hypothetical protein B296_00053972 [Ensete ventricosum]|uniref:Uncharacterized protein n=1 Tax=Ensete ventricosum TaxID=4639 RepID=A0A426XK31_ENSVE|nr:hypothetical protein B296_00053972 [Ensete ventricosum]
MVDFAIPLLRRGTGAFIVSVVGPSYLITLLPLRLTMLSYLSTMPAILATDFPHRVGHVGGTIVRGHEDVAARSTSAISFFPPSPQEDILEVPD